MDFSMQDIKYLPGVGPKKAALLASELGIHSVEDLLRHYPYKYVDRSGFIIFTNSLKTCLLYR